MLLLHCRVCGAEIDAQSRQLRCYQCGTLFPFACAVCSQPLRPPFPVYEDEKYLSENNEPLCQEHYLRQCPECKNWFRADENPGYFLCPACATAHAEAVAAEWKQRDEAEVNTARDWAAAEWQSGSVARHQQNGHNLERTIDYLVLAALCLAIAASMGVFGWIIEVLQRLFGR
ncbi:MAG: hypothetical protein M3347_01180 [Armatimonadota bacterium]|nr:hypothetical protein [Armatimonadota bacterium]